MAPVLSIADAIFCPLGLDSATVWKAVLSGAHSLKHWPAPNGADVVVSDFTSDQLDRLLAKFSDPSYSIFEKMCLWAAADALPQAAIDPRAADCVFVLSSTKGNIDLLGKVTDERLNLFTSAEKIGRYFGNPNRPVVVSNACISGSLALITAKRLIDSGRFRHAVVIGCDRVSDFVVAGFQSFQALDPNLCRPFDAGRKGLNLGAAAACMVLSASNGRRQSAMRLSGGGLSNDANHLSGPSRTGAELATAIKQALTEAAIKPEMVGTISAHGTATRYNDEMEAKAIALAGLSHAPLHSLKSYVGHTLGAAGIIESIIACKAMAAGMQIPTLRFHRSDAASPVAISRRVAPSDGGYMVKTSSGFGGCNAALVWQKYSGES